MAKPKDLTGQRFGRLIAIKRVENNKHGKARWLCKCDCGNETIVVSALLSNGHTTSCGCYNRERISETHKGKTVTEETRKKQSQARKGKYCGEDNPFYGKHHTDETKTRISETQKELAQREDYVNPFKGKHHTEETRHKQSESQKELYENGYVNPMKNKQHTEESKQKMSDARKHRWQDEEYRQSRTGENSQAWKGGISPISVYLRATYSVKKWTNNAKELNNYTCEISGLKDMNVEVHHIEPFCNIVKEAHEINNITIKRQVKDYTKEELVLLEDYIAECHKDINNAIVMTKDVHDYFHNVFMKGKNRESSIEDIEEFKQHYLNGEFDSKTEDVA